MLTNVSGQPAEANSERRGAVGERRMYEPRTPPVVYHPMSMTINEFKTEQVLRPLPGFGVLVPSKKQRIGGIPLIPVLIRGGQRRE